MSIIWKAILAKELHRIESGHWTPGEVFATTQSLADAHGVSKITARRVLIELAKSGRVKNVPRLGCVVVEAKKRPVVYLLSPDQMPDSSESTMLPFLLKGIFEEAIRQQIELLPISSEKIATLSPAVPAFLIYVYQLNLLDSNIFQELLPPNIIPCGVHCPQPPFRGVGIGADADGMMALQVKKLYDSGCRKIGYVGPASAPWFYNRFRGFLTSMRELNLSADLSNVCSGDNLEANKFKRWVRTFAPDGICTPGIQIAEHVVEQLSESELQTIKIGSIGMTDSENPKFFHIQPDYYAEGCEIIKLISRIDSADFLNLNQHPQYYLTSGQLWENKE